MTDQRGCVHSYLYDLLGRQTHDCVTTLPAGVDGAVRRFGFSYEVRGLMSKLTSYDNAVVGSGSIVNDVALTYNAFGQIVSDAQSHSGAVVPGTTPQVQYAYANGSTNTIRPTTLTYPNGRAITISYGTTGGINDSVSRVDGLIDGAATLVNYSYLGLGTAVQVTYPQPSLQYTLLGSSTGNSPAGDIYWGLDLFGRIIDSRWFNVSTTVDIDRIKYGYDRASNRSWRQNPVATNAGAQFDEYYTNDGLQRLKDMQRGTLNGTNTGITSPTFKQCWTLDATGNWRGFSESTNGSTWTLNQTRTANTVNEITGIATTNGTNWAVPTYDATGNMTTVPIGTGPTSLSWEDLTVDEWATLTVDNWSTLPVSPTTGSYTATYDAWNRMVKLVDVATGSIVQQNQYDARNFRTMILSYPAGTLSETRHSYFTSNWRCVEERLNTATSPNRQFVWGARYIDDLVERDRDATGSGTLNERCYAHQDANWNMSAVTTPAGAVAERYAYSAYGKTMFLSPTYGPRSVSSYAWETLFCGFRYDSSTQLVVVRHRIYNPALGSWMQRDPVQQASLYSFLSSNPYNRQDPLGLDDALKPKSLEQWQNQLKSQLKVNPSSVDTLLSTGKAGCIGYCSGELGIPYKNINKVVPGTPVIDVSRCFDTEEEAKNDVGNLICPGNNCRGEQRKARIIQLQFNDTYYDWPKKDFANTVQIQWEKVPNEKYYNLNIPTTPWANDDNVYDLISGGGTGSNKFNNYDFGLLLPDGTWIHSSAQGGEPEYATSNQMNLQFTATRRPVNETTSGNDYSFNRRFFCVLCEYRWIDGKPDPDGGWRKP